MEGGVRGATATTSISLCKQLVFLTRGREREPGVDKKNHVLCPLSPDGPRSNYARMTCLNEKRLLCDVIIGEISGIIKKLRMFPQLLRSYVGKVFRFSPVLPRMKVPLDHSQVSK